jgi:hypothetical protein
MSFASFASKVYLSRAQTRTSSLDHPVGDPFGGPAYREFNDPVTAGIAVGGSVIGGMIQGDAAEDAANVQVGASDRATAEQRRQYDLSREDLAPWRSAGSAAVNRQAELLGLEGTGRSLDQIVAELRSSGRFTLPASPSGATAASGRTGNARLDFLLDTTRQFRPEEDFGGAKSAPAAPQTDEAALMAEAKRIFNAQSERPRSADFGSLNRRFTMADFENDPVNRLSMQFGLDEGTKAIRRTLGASGMARSGAAVKALTRFSTDYAGQRAGESYNRFYADQDRTFNRLAGVSGTGQTATTNTAQLGANMATNVGNNIIGAGNARGAASIAQGNAMAGPFQTAGNMLQTRFLLDGMNRPGVPSAPRSPSFTMDNAFENFA